MFFSIDRTPVKLDRYTAWDRPHSGVISSSSAVLMDQDSTRDLMRDRTVTQPSVSLCPASSLKVMKMMLYFFSGLFFYFLSSFFATYGGFWCFGIQLGFWGWGFQLLWYGYRHLMKLLSCLTEKNPSNKVKRDYYFVILLHSLHYRLMVEGSSDL